MLRILFIYDVYAALPTYNFVVGTPLLYTCPDFHRCFSRCGLDRPFSIVAYVLPVLNHFVHTTLSIPIDDATFRKIIRRQLDLDSITG